MSWKKSIEITIWAILIVTIIWLVIGIKTIAPCDKEHVTPVEPGGTVYIIEQWDTGEMKVIAQPQYIKQLSDHTVLVTDRSLDDVQQEIMDFMEE